MFTINSLTVQTIKCSSRGDFVLLFFRLLYLLTRPVTRYFLSIDKQRSECTAFNSEYFVYQPVTIFGENWCI